MKKQQKESIANSVEPGKVSTSGLEGVDFDELNFITIVDQNGKRVMS